MSSRRTEYDIADRSLLQPWAVLAMLLLCVGHSIADAHLHLNGHDEEVCKICAISEPGQVPEIRWVEDQLPEWRPSNSVPVVSATISPRPYEFGRSRAPPFPVS